MRDPALRYCPECRQPWPVGAEHDLRSFGWLYSLPRSITPSNFDCTIHDGAHGRDRFLVFETKGPAERLESGQERLLRATAGLPRWDVFVLRGDLHTLALERVTSQSVQPAVPVTAEAVRASVVRWLDGHPWVIVAAPPPLVVEPTRVWTADDFKDMPF